MYAHDRLSFSDAIRVDRQASTSVESTISVVGVFSTLSRHKWKVIASLVAALALALAYLQMARPAYTATASVLIEPADAVTGLSEAFMPLQTADPELSTELEVITARETLGVVVERLDLTADPEFNAALREPPSFDPARLVRTAIAEALALIGTGAPAEDASAPLDESAVPETRAAIDALSNRISVDILGTTRIIEISVESYSREKAARIANAISEAYIEGLVSAKIEAQRFATAFYAEQVAELRDDVERSTAALQGFRAENVIVPENSVQTSSLEEFKRDLADIDVRVTSLSRQIEAFERVESGDAAPETLATALEHPSIAALAQEPDFARVRPRVASHVDALREQRQQSMARRDVLQTGLANLQSSLKVAAENRVRHGQLVLEAEASKALFEDFLQQQKRIATQQGIMTPGARVLNHAEPPYYPSSPRKGVVLVIAIALGLQIGCCWVMAIELRKDSFASIDDLERATGLQVLGSIPEDRRVRNGSALVTTVTLEYGGMLAEAVKGIRTSLLGPGGRDTCLVVAVTSSVAEESKSTTSAALAIVTAHIGKRVLVVDADTRRSFIHRIFKVDDSEGLLSVLKGETAFTDAIKRHEASGIDVLPVGASCPATADLLFSSAFPELITKLRDHYDVVVIDCPPVLPIVDTRAVVPCVDSVVYVVRWGDTPKRSVRRGLNILHDMGARVTGLVLTRIKPGGDQKYGYGEYGLYSQTYHSRAG